MARIRHILIENFRTIKSFEWSPSPGVNCLVGAGDSGKSTILDAIDCCLGARRSISFSDADFFEMNVSKPLKISVTLGELDDSLKTLESYGLLVRGFSAKLQEIEDEPDHDLEAVLTIELNVTSSLEPEWLLVSERAKARPVRGWVQLDARLPAIEMLLLSGDFGAPADVLIGMDLLCNFVQCGVLIRGVARQPQLVLEF